MQSTLDSIWSVLFIWDDLTSLVVLLSIYLFPTVIATARRHRNATAISVLNLLLGWTVLGWIVALIWASTHDVEPRVLDLGRYPRLPPRFTRRY